METRPIYSFKGAIVESPAVGRGHYIKAYHPGQWFLQVNCLGKFEVGKLPQNWVIAE